MPKVDAIDNTRPHRSSTKMPFAIEQANALTMCFFAGLGGLLFLLLTAGERRWWPVITGLALGFWVPAVVVALVPFNVFQGWGGPRNRSGGYPKIADLNLLQRRILVALYEPSNRRGASVVLLLTSAAWVFAWRLGLSFRSSELLVGSFIFSVITAAWAGLFGLTRHIRSRWDEIVSAGLAWPNRPEFSGPWREAVRSFFTGRLPEFITKNSGK